MWLLITSYSQSKRKPHNIGELLNDFSWLGGKWPKWLDLPLMNWINAGFKTLNEKYGYIFEAINASLLPSSNDVIGSAPTRIRARLHTATGVWAGVLETAILNPSKKGGAEAPTYYLESVALTVLPSTTSTAVAVTLFA